MTEHQFLRLSVWAPVVLPVVLNVVALGLNRATALPEWLASLAGFLGCSILAAGVPYLCFAVWSYRYLATQPLKVAVRLSLVAPVVVTLLFCGLLLFVGLLSDLSATQLPSRAAWVAQHGAIVLALGYAYVAVTHLCRYFLRSVGVLARSAA